MRGGIQRLALVFLGLLIGGVACEVGLWLIGRGAPAASQEAPREKGLMRPEQQTGWIPREGARLEKTDLEGRPYEVRINSSGQRGGEVGPRWPEQRRLLFLGDSFTMADQVREEDTFVVQVGHLLSGELNPPVEVINGGVNGYSTYQELAYYRYYGQPLEPDIVVLCFFIGNDFRDTMISTRQARFLNPVLIPRPKRYSSRHIEPFLRTRSDTLLYDPLSGYAVPRPSWAWVEWLERKLLLARLLGSRYARLKGRWTSNLELLDLHHRYYLYEIGFYQQRDDGFFKTARELNLECLELLQRMVLADGAELMVVVLPSQNQVDPQKWARTLAWLDLDEEDLGPLDKGYPNRLVQEFCDSRKIPCLDLAAAFSGVERVQELFLSLEDGHFSAVGHQLAASEMAAFIKQHSTHLKAPAVALFRRGLHYVHQGDWARAEQAFLQGLEEDGEWAQLWVELGEVYRRQESWVEAEQAFRRALASASAPASAWEGLAEVLLAQNDLAGASAAYEQALDLRPQWWPYAEQLHLLYAAQGLAPEAEESQRRVEAVFSGAGMARRYWWVEHTALGTQYAVREQWQRAEREFSRSARFIPDEPVSYYNLGMLYQKTGRVDQAVAAYRQAIEVAPDFSIAREMLREIQGKSSLK